MECILLLPKCASCFPGLQLVSVRGWSPCAVLVCKYPRAHIPGWIFLVCKCWPMWLLRLMSPEKSCFVAKPSPLVLCALKDLPFPRLTIVFQLFHVFHQLSCQWCLLRMEWPLSSHQRELDLEQPWEGALKSKWFFPSVLPWASSASGTEHVNNDHLLGGFCISLLKANDFQSCLETFIIIVMPGTTPFRRECEERGTLEWF